MASEDIAPKLIAGVRKEFQRNCLKDVEMRKLSEKAGNGEATYADAYRYAEAVGTARADAFGSVISSDVLPDGKMYYNIAERLMTDSLTTDHNMVADFSEMVQQAINDNRIGIDMKAQKADLDENRIDGFVQRLASADNYDDVAWITQEPVRVHARSVVDDTIKKNAEFQHKAGIKAEIKRDSSGDCCKWCDGLVGEYTYPGVPREVFARHDNCRCTLDYNGRRLTAYQSGGSAHSFRDQGEQEKIEARKELAKNNIKRIEATSPFANPQTPLKLDSYSQSKHYVGGQKYNEYMKNHEYPPSILTISEDEAQRLVVKYHGTGILKLDKNDNIMPQEIIVDNDKTIGYAVNNLNGKRVDTSAFKIHYSGKGTHIVPMYENQKASFKERRDNNGNDWLFRQKGRPNLPRR